MHRLVLRTVLLLDTLEYYLKLEESLPMWAFVLTMKQLKHFYKTFQSCSNQWWPGNAGPTLGRTHPGQDQTLWDWEGIRIDFAMVTRIDSTSNIVLACVERVKEVQISTTKLSKPKGKKEGAGKGDIFIATRGVGCSQRNRKRSRDFTLRFYHIWQSNYAISNCSSFLCFLFNSSLQRRSIRNVLTYIWIKNLRWLGRWILTMNLHNEEYSIQSFVL